MKATCRDVKCNFQVDNICGIFPASKTCDITGFKIRPDKPTPEVEKSSEYETFKEFILQLRREVNADDKKQGLCANSTNFAMVFKIIQAVNGLVTAITEDKDIKKELFKISCIVYKMWRNLN